MLNLPIKYILRSLTQRPLRTLLTVGGVGLSVFLSVMMLGMSRGLVASTIATGEELNILVLSKGAESIEFSALDPEALHVISSSSGIATVDGIRQASPEVNVNSLVSIVGTDMEPLPVLVRSMREGLGLALHPQVSIVEGRAPERGYELAVGPLVATRLGVKARDVPIGSTLEFEGQAWEVVGLLSAPGTAFEAEIWTQMDDLMVASKRDDYSSLLLATESIAARDELLDDLRTRTDVRTEVHIESDYYAAGVNQMKPVQAVAMLMTVLLVCGGLMTGMNTMFNSISGRIREMAVLQVMGYRRRDVLAGFVLESVALCLIAGLIGCAAGLSLNNLPMKFSMGAFRFLVDTITLSIGLGLALLIGVFGTIVPVMRVAGLKTVDGLRAQV